ncbi:MAG: zinc-binding dehydrogenase [Actinomycetota bacterium]|nr:zinc-binding dehydrogenase [Actinomycetota bacterium]
MYAIRQHEFGAPETLRYEWVDDPVPGEGQVRVVVEAAGVHLLDTMMRTGVPAGPMPVPELPMTPGREVAGKVDMVGDGVDGWLGKRVVVHLGFVNAGYAELVLAPATSLHELPDGLDAAEAVAMIGTGRTAVGVLESAMITADDVVLVLAAAGGLGTLFVQAAGQRGATVVGVAAGVEKIEQVRTNGADIAIDYAKDGWDDEVRSALGDQEVTVVLDGVGGELGRTAFELLGGGGRFVMFGYSSGELTQITSADLAGKGLTATWALGPAILSRPGGIRALETHALAEAAARRLVPAVSRFPLDQAAEAHRALEERRTVGKVVLIPTRSEQ